MKRLLRSFLALIAVCMASIAAFATDFTPGQKDEIGAVVREYLLKNPELIREVLQELERKETAAEGERLKGSLKDNAEAVFRSSFDLVAGNPKGNVTMVEFFDYNCGYCKRAFPDVMKMIEQDKELKLVLKEFPILGPGSLAAAKAALASRNQGKYWEFHLAMLGHEGHIEPDTVVEIAKAVGLNTDKLKTDMESEEIAAALAQNMALAQKLGIQGTPAFIVDETLIPGAIGYEGLLASVQQVRDQGGCKLC
jgi:protein-disulfide isomerase